VKYVLESVVPTAAENGVSIAAVLAGDLQDARSDSCHVLDFPKDLSAKHAYVLPGAHRSAPFSFARRWNTGRDIDWLASKFPEGRCKFYLSLQLDTPERRRAGEAFARDLVTECAKRQLSLETKCQDHLYDSCNVYTWDRPAMEKLIAELVDRHRDAGIFRSVPRSFQCAVDGVDAQYVGWVQEPRGGHHVGDDEVGLAHSSRMRRLGTVLDEVIASGNPIDVDAWTQACAAAGVRPEEPWLIAAT
jgi:hypothetical protein